MKFQVLVLTALSLLPALASAQQMGPQAPSPYLGRALEYADQLSRTRLDEPPKKLERKDFYDTEKFAAWAEGLRGQRELAAYLGEVLKTDEAKQKLGPVRAQQLQQKMDEVVKNRDAHLAVLGTSYMEELKAREEDRKRYANQPAFTLPPRPGSPRKIMSPQYMVAVDGLFPSPYGDAIGVGSMMKGAPRWIGVLDAINTGYSAGGWMGNEVIIKAQMAENYKRQREYEAAVKDWDKNVKPLWDENERRKRADAIRAAELNFRIFVALYGYPKQTNPALGTYNGGMGYSGGRYGSPYGGLGVGGPYAAPPASGAGIRRD